MADTTTAPAPDQIAAISAQPDLAAMLKDIQSRTTQALELVQKNPAIAPVSKDDDAAEETLATPPATVKAEDAAKAITTASSGGEGTTITANGSSCPPSTQVNVVNNIAGAAATADAVSEAKPIQETAAVAAPVTETAAEAGSEQTGKFTDIIKPTQKLAPVPASERPAAPVAGLG